MTTAVIVVAILVTGCACKQPPVVTPDPPVRVSRCHAIVEGVVCSDTAYRYRTMCSCVGDA